MPVHRPDPLGQEFVLRLLLLIILPFHFQNQSFVVRQPNQIIRPEFVNHALTGERFSISS